MNTTVSILGSAAKNPMCSDFSVSHYDMSCESSAGLKCCQMYTLANSPAAYMGPMFDVNLAAAAESVWEEVELAGYFQDISSFQLSNVLEVS